MSNQTVRVSVNSDGQEVGTPTRGGHSNLVISDSGRFIVFNSGVENLSPTGADRLVPDIYIRDVVAGTTERIGFPDLGDFRNSRYGGDDLQDISDDGRFVLFIASGYKQGLKDENGRLDLGGTSARNLFIYDRLSGDIDAHPITLPNLPNPVSISSATLIENGNGIIFTTNGGRYINADREIVTESGTYHYSVTSKTISKLSDQTDFLEGNETVSDDGDKLLHYDDNRLFIYDRPSGSSSEIGVKQSTGSIGNGTDPNNAVISGDGRFVAYRQYDNPLSLEFPGGVGVYVFDTETNTTRHVAAPFGTDVNQGGIPVGFSDDGRYLAFYEADLAAWSSEPIHQNPLFIGDRAFGLIVYDLQTGASDVVLRPVVSDSDTTPIQLPLISGDGQHLAYISYFGGLVENDNNQTADIFRTDNRLLVNDSGNNGSLQTLFAANGNAANGLSAAYQTLLGGVPNEAGFVALINAAVSTNFGAGPGPVFNVENIFINLTNNLVQGNPAAKARFDAIATDTTLTEKITSIYQALVPPSKQTAEGLAFITRPDGITFYQSVAAERGVAGTDGAAIVAMASLLQTVVSENIGVGNAVRDLAQAIAAGNAALPASGSTFTDIEVADGTAFDADDAAAIARIAAATEPAPFVYVDDDSASGLFEPGEAIALIGADAELANFA